MVEIWHELAQRTYSPKMQWWTEKDQLGVNMVSRLALNFLGIHRASIETCRRITQLDVGQLPLKSFRDLLLISAAVFLKLTHREIFGVSTEFVTLRIEDLCQQLATGVLQQ